MLTTGNKGRESSNKSILMPDPIIFTALLVEILSEGNRKLDETIKRQRYAHYGVPEYWIIDPELDLVKIYRFAADQYGQATILTREAKDILSTPLLPGMSLPLVTLFK